MRAAVITGHGDLDVVKIVDDLPVPEPKSDEVRIAIKAVALNRLDLWVRKGWRGLDLAFPHPICADGAGVINAVGDRVTNFAPGDRVAVNPTIVSPDSPALITGLENQSRIHILGETAPGVACEFAVVPARNLVKIPDHFGFEGAAAAGLVYLTAWHSLITRGGLRAGESVLIIGAGGGVNSASIQIAKLAGAKVYVVGSTAEKCEKAQQLGADITINREEEANWSKAMYKMTARQGVDVVIDNVGQATLIHSIRSARMGGRVLVVGNTSGPLIELDIRLIFARQVSIIGSTMGSHQDYIRVMNLIFSGVLLPVIGTVLPLKKMRRGQEMLENLEVYGKVIFKL